MLDSALDWPGERFHLRGPVAVSAVLHVLFVFLFVLFRMDERLTTVAVDPEAPLLGFFGPRHAGTFLELPLPNALHFYFYQPPRAGVAGGSLESRRTAGGEIALREPSPPITRRRAAPAPIADGALPAPHAASAKPTGFPGQSTGSETGPPPAALPALQPDLTFSEDFVIVRFVKPIYPEQALQKRVSANVVVALHVAGDGDIDAVQVERSESDPPGSTAAFELTALDALRQWRIRGPAGGDRSQGWWFIVPIEYRPDDKDFTRLQGLQGLRPLSTPPARP